MNTIASIALLGSFALHANAHGLVSGIVANGKYYTGYNPSMQYQDPPPTVVGWSIPEDQDLGFVAPSAYSSADIICHKGATNAGTHAVVKAGTDVELQWTEWPESHHGPVLTYLANCNGKCETVNKKSLEFFKIDAKGLIDDSVVPGTWATDKLIANNNSWTVTIPETIAAGNYVLRHEIIALHSAGNDDGAQSYPQCINLKVTGSGTDNPAGIKATKFYKADDPGILVNIYQTLSKYVIPGPKKYKAGSSSAGTTTAKATKTKTASSTVVEPVETTPSSTTIGTTPSATVTASPTSTPSFTTSLVPTGTATGGLPTGFPEPTGGMPNGTFPGGPGGFPHFPHVKPSPPPKGTTLKDLFSWLAFMMQNVRGGHARDFGRQ